MLFVNLWPDYINHYFFCLCFSHLFFHSPPLTGRSTSSSRSRSRSNHSDKNNTDNDTVQCALNSDFLQDYHANCGVDDESKS